MKRMVAVLVLAVAACKSSPTLSESFCNDLRGGATMVSLYRSGGFKDGQTFADRAYGMIAVSCPEQLQNPDVRSTLEAWGIDPDA